MKSPHILLLEKNLVVVKRELAGILTKKSLVALDKEIAANVKQLFLLGEQHFKFAQALPSAQWRQTISRCYYGAYSVSKAIRLAVNGHYSREVKDHEKVGELPDDFPSKSTYANQLKMLRDDRNLCDYDHSASETDLAISRKDSIQLVQDFIGNARIYLKARKHRV